MYGRGGGGPYLWANAEFIDFSQLCQLVIINKALVCTSRGSLQSAIPSVCHYKQMPPKASDTAEISFREKTNFVVKISNAIQNLQSMLMLQSYSVHCSKYAPHFHYK